MKIKKLFDKLNKLNSIYDLVNAEIEAYNIDIRKSIYENWTKRKHKIQINLINQFRKDELADFMQWLIKEKYCLENPIEDCVNDYIKLTKQK